MYAISSILSAALSHYWAHTWHSKGYHLTAKHLGLYTRLRLPTLKDLAVIYDRLRN